MSRRFLWKLLAINVLAVGLAVAIVGVAIHVLAAKYFTTLMREYDIAPADAHRMFLDAVQRYLFAASLLACGFAAGLSYWLTRRMLAPLAQMRESAARVAAGDYSVRVRRTTRDEIGDLADAFNRMTDSLLRIERLRTEMVANVAHELRTPLTNIRGYLEGLIDGVVPPSTATFESLHEETLRLVGLVEGVLQLARADSLARASSLNRASSLARANGGEFPDGTPADPPRVPVRLDESAAQAVDLFRLRFAEKGIAVSVDLSAAAVTVHTERGATCQVMLNLLENAWRYTPAGGRVRVSAERSGGMIRVVVGNEADGLRETDVPLLFERFFRGERSRSREHGGAGVGLAIVKELVETHAGRVGASAENGWLEIWFELPVADPESRS